MRLRRTITQHQYKRIGLDAPFLAAIWLRRSEILMGRIPSLGVHGDRLATSSLLFDGRARLFAVGPRFESLNITSFGRLPLC